MNKILDYAKKHKGLAVLIVLGIIIALVFLVTIITLLIGTGRGVYGDRLDGIKEVEITKDELADMKNKVTSDDSVKSASFRIQGKIVYTTIKFNEGTNLDSAKEIANGVLSNFSKDEIKYYDFEFFLKEDKTDGFVITGNKHPNVKDIGWIHS